MKEDKKKHFSKRPDLKQYSKPSVLKMQPFKKFIDEVDTIEDVGFTPLIFKNLSVKKSANSFYTKAHHIPPESFIYIPINMRHEGFTVGNTNIESEIKTTIPTKRLLKDQVNFWFNLKPLELETEDCKQVNSLKLTVITVPPYKGVDLIDEKPLIGIYKSHGPSAGQAVWFTLPIAQVMVKLFINHINSISQELQLTPKPKKITQIAFDLSPIEFNPPNFLELGIGKDFVCSFTPEKYPDLDKVLEKWNSQISKDLFSDSSYNLGSVEVSYSACSDRYLFSITQRTGATAGQRVWFSIHELIHVTKVLPELIENGFTLFKNKTESD